VPRARESRHHKGKYSVEKEHFTPHEPFLNAYTELGYTYHEEEEEE